MTSEKRLHALLTQAQSLYPQEIELSLGRVEALLHTLGNPHLVLPPVVHVAGTNGKGSTLAILRALLEQSGKSVHVMTSPHLVHITERIRLAGHLITADTLADTLDEVLQVNNGAPITYFEVLTIASFVAMSRVPADFTLVETGMGGRYDATNVIPQPVCTIITNISRDHQEFLGDHLTQIAYEKAGIMKSGVPCVIGKQSDEALSDGVMDVFQQQSTALSCAAPLMRYGLEWHIDPMHDRFQFTWNGKKIICPPLNLMGEHQYYNAGAAMGAYRIIMDQQDNANILSPSGDQKRLVDALGTIDWPGRLQKITKGRLFDQLKPDQELWLDGGHNAEAGHILAAHAQKWQQEDAKPLYVVMAMMARKDPLAFLTPLRSWVRGGVAVSLPHEPDAFTASALADKINSIGLPVTQGDMARLFTPNNFPDDARILMTGSLYFLGDILKNHNTYS